MKLLDRTYRVFRIASGFGGVITFTALDGGCSSLHEERVPDGIYTKSDCNLFKETRTVAEALHC